MGGISRSETLVLEHVNLSPKRKAVTTGAGLRVREGSSMMKTSPNELGKQ